MTEIPRMEPREAALLNPLQLAYMGDAVWEMIVRSRLLAQRKNVHHMHTECVNSVNAAAQARDMARIRPGLSDEEAEIATRGRNAHAKHPAPRHQDPADYAEATAFETLLGYLYLTGNFDRIRWIQEIIFEEGAVNA